MMVTSIILIRTSIITKAMMILILMVFTYSPSDSKNKTYYVEKQYQQSQ
jgi:hypothetical protein